MTNRDKRYDEYGNIIEKVSVSEQKMIESMILKNRTKVDKIKNSNACLGDKAREIIKAGITNNSMYARKILEIV